MNIRIQWLVPIIVIMSLMLVGCGGAAPATAPPQIVVVTVEVTAAPAVVEVIPPTEAPAEVAASAVEEAPIDVKRPDIFLESPSPDGSVIFLGAEGQDGNTGYYPPDAEVKLNLLVLDEQRGLFGPGLINPNSGELLLNSGLPESEALNQILNERKGFGEFLPLPVGYYWQAEGGFTSKPNGEAKWIGPEQNGIAFLFDPNGDQVVEMELFVEFLGDPAQVAEIDIDATVAAAVAATQAAQPSASDTLAAQPTNTPVPAAPAPVEVPPTATPIPPIVQTTGAETKVIYHDGDFQNGVGTYPDNVAPWLDLLVKLDGAWYGPEREPDDGINAAPLPDGFKWKVTGGFGGNPNGEVWWDGPEFVGVGLLYNLSDTLVIEVPLEVGFFSVGGSDGKKDKKCDAYDTSCNDSGSSHDPHATPSH